ncbi:hypothetical protein FB451DRAFT_1197411 [Mycena latifolia]|nr:hypothetical protein FB451DRAFT_1197411 [Mycena latifolia]
MSIQPLSNGEQDVQLRVVGNPGVAPTCHPVVSGIAGTQSKASRLRKWPITSAKLTLTKRPPIHHKAPLRSPHDIFNFGGVPTIGTCGRSAMSFDWPATMTCGFTYSEVLRWGWAVCTVSSMPEADGAKRLFIVIDHAVQTLRHRCIIAFGLSVQTAPTVSSPASPIATNAAEIAQGSGHSPGQRTLQQLLTDGNGNSSPATAPPTHGVDFNNQAPATVPKGGSILLATTPLRAGERIQHCGADAAREVPGDGVPDGQHALQQNPTCSPAAFVASLNSEDPGRSDTRDQLLMLPSDVVDASWASPTRSAAGNIDAWRSHLRSIGRGMG